MARHTLFTDVEAALDELSYMVETTGNAHGIRQGFYKTANVYAVIRINKRFEKRIVATLSPKNGLYHCPVL
jgi:hypothetical protein